MRRLFAIAILASLSLLARAQPQPSTPSLRLVMPPSQGPGAILIDTSAPWKVDIFKLADNNKRPILQLHNETNGIIVSYILDNAPGYYDTSEACKNDVLNGVMHGALAKATVKNQHDSSRTLPNGLTLSVGSYFVAKNEGVAMQEQAVFGFIAQNHTCAWIHLSKLPVKPGNEAFFDPSLDAFRYDPNYSPTGADYAAMASLLPPVMAASYQPPAPATTGQTPLAPQTMAQSLDFALPNHPGFLHMDAPSYSVTELSAKPNGSEYGLRAKDQLGNVEVLAFLFLPDPVQPTAVACRDWMIKSEQPKAGYRKVTAQREMMSDSGVPIAIIEYEQSKVPSPYRYVRRALVASGDLCADIQFTYALASFAAISDPLLATLTFDPTRQPDFFARFRYATVLFDHHDPAAAAPVYAAAIALADTTDKPVQWRRVATDQSSMSYGMSGDLAKSRAINEAAIAKDPGYPLYYYNLACADAEAGNAAEARKHLQQAFDRRANTLPGEKMPNPATDDSFLKLKADTDFWKFVQSLPRS